MLELYLSISNAISKVPENKWVDIGPRVPEHTVIYPATFVQDIIFLPQEMGDKQYYGEFTFTVVTYLKPYHGSLAKPKTPDLDKLAEAFTPAVKVRQAIYDLCDPCVQNTVFLRETISCDREGMYAVTQFWKALATVSFAPPSPQRLNPSPKLSVQATVR